MEKVNWGNFAPGTGGIGSTGRGWKAKTATATATATAAVCVKPFSCEGGLVPFLGVTVVQLI